MTMSGGSGAMCAGKAGEKLTCNMGGGCGALLLKGGMKGTKVPRPP